MFKAPTKLTLLIALGVTCQAQEVTNPSTFNAKNYWGFSLIMPAFSEKAKIEGDKDEYDLHSHAKFGLESLIQYHLNFSKNYSLIFGAGGSIFNTCFHYHIPKEMFDPPIESDLTFKGHPFGYSFNGPHSIKVQAELLRRWQRNKAHNWNLTAGLSLLYSLDFGEAESRHFIDYPNGQTKQYLTVTFNSNNDEKPWMNYHFSGGHEWVLKSKDMLQVNLKLNLSPTDPFTATYLFTTGIQPDLSGTFKSSGTYIGLSITYIDTRVTFRIKNKNRK